MKALLIDYKEYLSKNFSENTVTCYMGDLLKFLGEYDIKSKKGIAKTDSGMVDDYIALLKSRGMAYSSIARTVASLKKFFFYCQNNSVKIKGNIDEISLPASKRKLPNTITEEEVIKLLESPDTTTPKGLRDKALLELMYATGARVTEIVSLKVGDVSLKNEMVVLASMGKHRFVPLGSVCVEALMMYLKEARSKLIGEDVSDFLFVNFYGQQLTRQGCWKIIKHYIIKAGINPNVTAQTVRHSFALHLLKNGADVNSVSEMLGFSDVASTKVYIDVMNNKIKEVYRLAHPRA